jgi:hypothetical protein
MVTGMAARDVADRGVEADRQKQRLLRLVLSVRSPQQSVGELVARPPIDHCTKGDQMLPLVQGARPFLALLISLVAGFLANFAWFTPCFAWFTPCFVGFTPCFAGFLP